jgi:flagellar biosynthesis/type III secretory pathway chaperone
MDNKQIHQRRGAEANEPAPPREAYASTLASPCDESLHLDQMCHAHLDQEEAVLESAAEVLRQVHAAVVEGQREKMAELLERQVAIARALDRVRQQRERFCQQAAAVLGTEAHPVTLRKLADQMPAILRERLLQRRQHLHRLAGEVERLGRDVALLSHYFLEFLQRFFMALTGGHSGRYGREGIRQQPACGSFLRAQG